MSVHVHVGQCGNQLGASYWQLAASTGESEASRYKNGVSSSSRHLRRVSSGSIAFVNADNSSLSLSRYLFHPSTRTARCILVDSEPKVVQSVSETGLNGQRPFQPAHTHVEQAGRGNNWAMGYNGPRLKTPAPKFVSLGVNESGELVDQVMDSLHREIEALDCYQGSVVMHSLGGGTGSGLGCRVLERMRDTYPKAYIVTASVAPSCKCGDTPLQNYNSLLTLKCLSEVADVVIYKDNDDLLRTAGYWKAIVQKMQTKAGRNNNAMSVSLDEMNSMAGADLAGLLLPVTTEGATTRPFDFGKLLHDVCPMPSLKMIDVRSGVWKDCKGAVSRKFKAGAVTRTTSAVLFHAPVVPHVNAFSQQRARTSDYDESLSLLEKLLQQTTQSFPRSIYTLASSTVVRGFAPAALSVNESGRFTSRLGELVDKAFPPVPWLASTPQTSINYSTSQPFPALQAKASVTVCVNNGSFMTSTRHFLERAQRQYNANAYVHWYKQHGLEDIDFESAFDSCASLISDYDTILR